MRNRGFSLVEITVVLAIVGLMLALVAPRFAAQRDGAAARAAIGELGSIFSAARQTAVTRRAYVAVVVDTAGGVVEVRSRGQTIVRRSLRQAYGVALASNRDSMVYDPRGIGYGVSNLTLAIHRGRIVDTLTISRLGRVRW